MELPIAIESKPKPSLTTDELQCRLEAKYPPPAWLTLWEVRDATGYGASRSADAIAFGVWPSRGLSIVGFEIKSSRSDWLRERASAAASKLREMGYTGPEATEPIL